MVRRHARDVSVLADGFETAVQSKALNSTAHVGSHLRTNLAIFSEHRRDDTIQLDGNVGAKLSRRLWIGVQDGA